jgi:hypothetical protein
MASTLNPTRSEFSDDPKFSNGPWPARPSVDAIIKRPSRGRRATRSLIRLLIIFGVGVGATLAWQSYGDTARAMIVDSFPQLGWLAPQAAHPAQLATDAVALAAPSAGSPELQHLKEMSVLFAALRQSVDQLAANQQEMAGDIAKLLVDQQELLQKASAPAPRAAPAPARKPAPPPTSEAR